MSGKLLEIRDWIWTRIWKKFWFYNSNLLPFFISNAVINVGI